MPFCLNATSKADPGMGARSPRERAAGATVRGLACTAAYDEEERPTDMKTGVPPLAADASTYVATLRTYPVGLELMRRMGTGVLPGGYAAMILNSACDTRSRRRRAA